MTPTQADAHETYQRLLRGLDSLSLLNYQLPGLGEDDAIDTKSLERVEALRAHNRGQMNEAWLNAKQALRHTDVPVPEPEPYAPGTVVPTAEDLNQALDFAPAMTSIQQNLPVTKPTFSGFASMRSGMAKTVIIAAVIAMIVAMTRPDNAYEEVHGGGGFALLLLLVCAALAARDWARDCRPVAERGQWRRTDARYVGALCLTIFLPTFSSWLMFTIMSF